MKKTTIILIIVLVLIIAFAYWLFFIPSSTELSEKENMATLFHEEDYKIEEKGAQKLITIERIGFSAVIPGDWSVEKVNTAGEDTSTFIQLLSPDVEIFDIITKGCGISILAGLAKEQSENILKNIEAINNQLEISGNIPDDYQLEVVDIDKHQALKWTIPDKPVLGQVVGVDIPMKNDHLVSLDTRFPEGYKIICEPIWEEFLDSITIIE